MAESDVRQSKQERCRELKESLRALTAQIDPKPADAAPDWLGGVVHPGRAETLRDSPDIRDEIRRVERALEAEGCLD
jgi:hypothetical protein